jgi:hypothetical protein
MAKRGLRSIGINKIIPAQIDWASIPSGSVNNSIRILGLADDNTSSYFTVFRSIKTPNGIVTSNGDGNFNVENVTIKNNVKDDGNYMYRTGVEMTLTSSLWFDESKSSLLGSGSVVLDPPRVFITSNELNNGSYNEPRLLFRRNKSPTGVTQEEELSLGSIIWFTDDRTSVGDVAKFHARIEAQAHANWQSSPSNSYPTNLYFYTTAVNSSTSDIRMTVAHNGNVGIGTTTPDQKLDVAGIIAISSEQGSAPAQPSDGVGLLYTKADGKLYWRSNDITETDLIAGGATGDITGVTAGSGLTGGGDTGAVTLTVGEGTGITVASTTVSTNDSEIVHDNLSGFVANEHIDHSGVTITAGDGLTGGGTIASTRTLAVGAGTGITVNANDVAFNSADGTTTTTNSHIDHVLINDGGVFKKIAPGSINISGLNNDSGFTTNTGDITGVTAGDGLTGGGSSGGVTLTVGAGTGIDVSSTQVSVDVSDFMTNGSDNRVVTAAGTDTMNAEANMTFDGSTLTVSGDTSLDGAVVINESSADKDFRVESNADEYAIYLDAGSSEVGIGTNNPTAKLHVNGTLTCEGTASFVQGLDMGGTEFRNDNVSNLTIRPAENKDIVFSTADGALADYEPVLRVDSAQYVAVKSLVVTGSGGNHGLKTQAATGDLEIYAKLGESVDIATGTALEGVVSTKLTVHTSDTYSWQDIIRSETGDPRFVVRETTTGIAPTQGDIGGIDFKGYNYYLNSLSNQTSKFADITAQRVSGASGVAAGSLELRTLPSYNATLKTGVKIYPGGQVRFPNQPAFLAEATADTNLAKDGIRDLRFETPTYDTGGDFNASNETFTAPVDGKYFFYFQLRLNSLDTAADYYYVNLRGTNTSPSGVRAMFRFNPDGFDGDTFWTVDGQIIVALDEGDAVKLQFYQSGGSNQTDIFGGATYTYGSFFGGHLIS